MNSTLKKIALIGGGNMAAALVGGLRAKGFAGADIVVADRAPAQLEKLKQQFGVETTTDNVTAAKDADLIVLAVKPQDLGVVAQQLSAAVKARRPLILSVAAGIRVETIRTHLDGFERIVRAMPNRPALIGKGITALFAPDAVDAGARAAVEQVLNAVGAVVWVEHEEQMDAVTAVSGSGPAYFFLLIELLEEAARELGLPPQTARTLAVQTAYGAGCMAQDASQNTGQYPSGGDPAQLRIAVTSPGGTTAAALAVLENADLRGIVRRAVTAACRRSAELAS